MSRKLVTVRQLVVPPSSIPGADNIELGTVDGWQCVIKKGEFKVGDLGVYFEVDSFLPTSDPRFSFLEKQARDWNGKRGAVIRTIKLRGQLSQGLFLPLHLFPEITEKRLWGTRQYHEMVNRDWADELGVEKYEKYQDVPPIRTESWLDNVVRFLVPKQYRAKVFSWIYHHTRKGQARFNPFPEYLKKTDQERVQNLWNKFTDEQKLCEYEVTTKMDGSSAQYFYKDGKFGLTSRNMKRGLKDGSHFAQFALDHNIEDALTMLGKNISLCGELMGPKIQGNREGFVDFRFFLFDIWDIDQRKYLGRDERIGIVEELARCGLRLETCPFVGIMNLSEFESLQQLLSFAEGPSLNHSIREGLVFKSLDGSFSFKVINNQFLLKEDV